MQNETVDVAVVGAGPAGITAALYAARKALKVRIFDAKALGGQTAEAIWVENYPGFEKMSGSDLMQKMASHLKRFGVEVEEAAEVTGIEKKKDFFELDINGGEEKVRSRSVILCTGSEYRTLGVPGEKEFYGKGVSYCATCDGPSFKGKAVAVVGAGNSGANAAIFFGDICRRVFLIDFSEKPGFDRIYEKPLAKSRAELMLNSEVRAVAGKERVTGLNVRDRASGKERVLPVDGVFIYIGLEPRNALAKKLGLKLDAQGYIGANGRKESSMKGVFVAGDVTGEQAQTIVAAGSGAIAATTAFEFVKGLE